MTNTGYLENWAAGRYVPAYIRYMYMRLDDAQNTLGLSASPERVMEDAYDGFVDDMDGDTVDARRRWDDHAADCLQDLRDTTIRPWKKKDDKREAKVDGDKPEDDGGPVGKEAEEELATIRGKKVMAPTECDMPDLNEMKLKPLEWIVDGLIPVGVTILGAPPKSYKSFMMLDLCACVADGRDFLGKHTSQHATLYLDLESTWRRPQMRMRQIMGEDAAMPTKLHISTGESGWERIGEGFEEQLTYMAHKIPDLKLVVIDVLQCIRPMGNARQKEYYQDYAVMGPLKRLADELDLAIICVTHTTKMQYESAFNNLVGSSGITGSSDCQISIVKKDMDTEGRLVVKGREVEAQDLEIRFDTETMRWECLGTAEDRAYQQQQEAYMHDEVVSSIIIALHSQKKWEGTAEDLINQSKDQLQGWDTRTVGRHIAKYEGLLRQNDHIDHEMIIACVGGQTQRRHIFTRI